MRTDISTTFADKKDAIYRVPIQLLIFHFSSGDIIVSDRVVFPGTLPLVESWGVLSTSGSDVESFISETMELSIVLWNGGEEPFSNRFSLQDPVNVRVDLYQLFDGMSFDDKVIIGTFSIQDPISFSEASRLLTLDLVSLNTLLDSKIGTVLTKIDWPKALDLDVNKSIDLIIGDAGKVKTLCAKTPIECTLSGSILRKPTSVNVYENLSTLGFAQSGYIRIEEELLHYSSRDENTFFVDSRGQIGTIITEHSDGEPILEYITDHTYIIGQGPISSVSDIMMEGQLASTSLYTLELASNPALIKFNKQPTYVSYSKGARSIELGFDSVGGANTAFQAFYAYQEAEKANGAVMSKDLYRILSIVQNDLAQDEGMIVRSFLSVEHWCTGNYLNDRVGVWVAGVGTIGYLSRPNERDDIDFTANVDIYHGHEHEQNSQHGHSNTGVGVGTTDPKHPHALPNITETYVDAYNGFPVYIGTYSSGQEFTLTYPSRSNITYQDIKVSANNYGTGAVELRRNGVAVVTWPGSVGAINITWPSYNNGAGAVSNVWSLYAYKTNVVGANVRIAEMTRTTRVLVPQTNSNTTGVAANVTSQPAIYHQNVDIYGNAINKLSTDVADIAASERTKYLNLLTTTNPGRTLVERFDITQYLETIDWAWFQNREVQLQYIGSSNAVDIIIVHAFFEVEYRPRQILNTNNITCKPIGSISNRPDKVIEHILTTAGFSTSIMDSIWTNPISWNDVDIWDDSEIWIDSGQQLSAPPGAIFAEAAAKYVSAGYTIDGIISGDSTAKEALKNICKQTRSRLIWSAGKIKLAMRGKNTDWQTIKEIGKDEIEIKSVTVSKEPISRINNDIDIFYDIDNTSNNSAEAKYNKSTNLKDLDSIAIHGQKKDNSNWLFDLVRNSNMAADLADYYLWRFGESATIYKFNSYIQQFELEKEDVLRLTSDFANTNNLPMRVADSIRAFGSGKERAINKITMTCESIRHKLYSYRFDDSIVIDDYSNIDFGSDYSQIDSAPVSDLFAASQSTISLDQAFVLDVIRLLLTFRNYVSDSVTSEDILSVLMIAEFSDVITTSDSVNIQFQFGFGRVPFGDPDTVASNGFGGSLILQAQGNDSLLFDDDAVVSLHYLQVESDSIDVDDIEIIRPSFPDSVLVEESFIFDSGFGCPVAGATGFGLNNFGR